MGDLTQKDQWNEYLIYTIHYFANQITKKCIKIIHSPYFLFFFNIFIPHQFHYKFQQLTIYLLILVVSKSQQKLLIIANKTIIHIVKNSKPVSMNMLKSIKQYLFNAEMQPQSLNSQEKVSNLLQIELSQKCRANKVIRWKDGTVYIGECNHMVMEGQGKLIFPNGDFYQGEFKHNNFDGLGKYCSQSGLCQSEGQWKNGLKNGYIKETNQDASYFAGKYENGMKQGMGYLEWADGSFYQGMFKQDFMQGPGKITFANGEYLQGEWKENQLHGLGREMQANGNIYIGRFLSSLKHGKGLLIQKQHKIQGVWNNGVIVGAALLQHNNGIFTNVKIVDEKFVEIDDNQYQKLASSVTEITQQ